MSIRFLVVAVLLTLSALLISACGAPEPSAATSPDGDSGVVSAPDTQSCDQFVEDEACADAEYATGDPSEDEDNHTVSSPDADETGARTITISMKAPVGVYQTGTTVIRADGAKTVVEISLTPSMNWAQPAHIHQGVCSTALGPVTFVLQDIVNGESTTVINKPIGEVIASRQLVNVHRSASDFPTSTACGEIPIS